MLNRPYYEDKTRRRQGNQNDRNITQWDSIRIGRSSDVHLRVTAIVQAKFFPVIFIGSAVPDLRKALDGVDAELIIRITRNLGLG